MAGETGLRYCPTCDGEYMSWVERCIDCGAELVDEPPAPPEAAASERPWTDGAEPANHAIATISLDGTTVDQRDVMAIMLRGSDIPFELTDTELRLPESRRDEAEDLIGWVDAGDDQPDTDEPPRSSLPPVPRPFRRPGPGGTVVAPRWRRLAGWYLDGLVLWFMVLGTRAVDLPALHIPVVAVYVIGATSMWGQTIGKFAAGTRVIDITASPAVSEPDVAQVPDTGVADSETTVTAVPPSLQAAAIRWLPTGVVTVVGWIPSPPVHLVAFIVLVATYAPVLWDSLGRGLHDRLARTMVVADPASLR